MTDITVRPTAKFLNAGALVCAAIVVALEIGCLLSWNDAAGSALIMIAPPLLLLWPASRAFRRRFTCAVITAERLRYETGITSRSTRTIQLANIQDVTVNQSLMQRIFNIGNIAIETAGETSRLTIPNIDNPQGLADEILNRAHRGAVQP